MPTSNVTSTLVGDVFIDTASYLGPKAIKEALASGVRGFMKYTRYDNTVRGKYWTAPEYEAVLDMGGYVMSNWEIQADRATSSNNPYATGLSDGARNRAWLDSIGYPRSVSAPVSVDQNTIASNFNQVHEFCRGHWDGDGPDCENMAYLDTDGGRALADLNPRIWIPGAFAWSPELYSLNIALKALGIPEAERYRQITVKAAGNPQAVAIQYPSRIAFGISVDFNQVLKPFNVWCAPYEVTPPPVKPLPPIINTESDMAYIITTDDPARNPAIIDAGYATGIDNETLFQAKLPVQPVSHGVWDALVAQSNAQKQRDAHLLALSTGGDAAPAPTHFNISLSGTANAG